MKIIQNGRLAEFKMNLQMMTMTMLMSRRNFPVILFSPKFHNRSKIILDRSQASLSRNANGEEISSLPQNGLA